VPDRQAPTGRTVTIRAEAPGDQEAIHDVTEAAFATLDLSDGSEPAIIEALRVAGALTLSLVAEHDGHVLGHIAFSPVQMSDGSRGWYVLGPVSVLPECSRRGIGTALITAGLDQLRAAGAAGVVLVGHPEYYPRFGFRNSDTLTCADGPPEAFFVLPFTGAVPRGSVHFPAAFSVGAATGTGSGNPSEERPATDDGPANTVG
jgi:putative acetyltransferase